MDVETLVDLLRETEESHGRYEANAPEHEWPVWYGAYMSSRQQGRSSDEAFDDASAYVERQLAGE